MCSSSSRCRSAVPLCLCIKTGMLNFYLTSVDRAEMCPSLQALTFSSRTAAGSVARLLSLFNSSSFSFFLVLPDHTGKPKTLQHTKHIMHCTLHMTHRTLHTTHYALCITPKTLYTAHDTLHITHDTLHTTHYSLHTMHYT